MTAPDVGDIESIEVRLDDASLRPELAWKLAGMRITHPTLHKTYVFELNDWLGAGYGFAKTLMACSCLDAVDVEEEAQLARISQENGQGRAGGSSGSRGSGGGASVGASRPTEQVVSEKAEEQEAEKQEEEEVEEDKMEEGEAPSVAASNSRASLPASASPRPLSHQSSRLSRTEPPPEAELSLAVGSRVDYQLVLVTGAEDNATTEGDRVWVSVRGANTRTPEVAIGRTDFVSGHTRFQRGQVRAGSGSTTSCARLAFACPSRACGGLRPQPLYA